MSEEVRQRRIRLQQAAEAGRFKARFTRLQCFDFHNLDEFQPWVYAAKREMNQIDIEPSARISGDVDTNTLHSWLESFLIDSGMGERFYLGTTMSFFPWLDCKVKSSGWVSELVEIMGLNLMLISGDKARLVATYEEEYEYLAFRRSQPPDGWSRFVH